MLTLLSPIQDKAINIIQQMIDRNNEMIEIASKIKDPVEFKEAIEIIENSIERTSEAIRQINQ